MITTIKAFLRQQKTQFIRIMLQGIFWLMPIVAIVMILLWLYDKAGIVTTALFNLIGLNPANNSFLWTAMGVVILLITAYLVGHFVQTRLGSFLESLFTKIPGYKTIKDLIGIFNSSKKGEKQVLVVMIKGFATQGYNIGLMYSQQESILKDHYTVVLSQTPIPNGGYMFEVHKDNIYIIQEATFDDNLKYLLSMGVRSLPDILQSHPKTPEELVPLQQWLENETTNTIAS